MTHNDVMIRWADLPYLLGSCIFVLLAIRLILVDVSKQTRQANTFLVVVFLVFALLQLDEFFSNVLPNWQLPEFITYVLFSSHLLLGPLTYLYIVNMLFERRGITGNIKHLMPFIFLICLVSSVDLFVPKQSAELLLVSVFISLYLATLLPYILLSLTALDRYIGESKNLFSNLLNHNLNWARFWLLFMLLLAIIVVVNPLLKWLGLIENSLFDIHYLVTAAGLVLLVWPNSAEQVALSRPTIAKDKGKNLTEADTSLTPIYAEIKEVITNKKLYLRNGLTLTDVANDTGYGIERISKAINQVAHTCFYDFINDFRVEESKTMLISRRSRSVIDIAMDAGFNSKSAFYTAFKKRENCTPSMFRKQNH